LHAAALAAQPTLRVETVKPGAGGWQSLVQPALLGVLAAATGWLVMGTAGATAGALAAGLATPALRRWQASRGPGEPVRGGLPRQWLP
jgi:hypothetical protein